MPSTGVVHLLIMMSCLNILKSIALDLGWGGEMGATVP